VTTDERLETLENQMAELLTAVKALSAVPKPAPKRWWEQIDARTVMVGLLVGGLLFMYVSGQGGQITDAFMGFVSGLATWWFKSTDERQNDQRVTQALYSSPPMTPPTSPSST
jgi:hypothetical protein